MPPKLPELAERDVIQVVMTEAFYRAHFRPLLEAQDFLLFRIPSDDPDDDLLPTYGIAPGDSRMGFTRTTQ